MLQQLSLGSEPLNLDMTMSSGQTFRWKKDGNSWTGWVYRSFVSMYVEGNYLQYRSSPRLPPEDLARFLTLDLDCSIIHKSLPNDKITQLLKERYMGLRILRQDPWECLASYIISASMSIPAINAVLDRIASAAHPRQKSPPLPTPQELLLMKRPSRQYLGRKWTYLKGVASELVNGNLVLEELRRLDYSTAWNKLVLEPGHIFGVGPKVADCTLLFSLDKLEAFPIDRWVLRGLVKHYPAVVKPIGSLEGKIIDSLSLKTYSLLSESARRYFGRYSGVLQEYLFVHSRLGNSSLPESGN